MSTAAVTSEVGIANMALSFLGQQPIISLGDRSKQAVHANQRFGDVRDSTFRDHRWNSVSKKVVLTTTNTAPVWGFSTAHSLPSDFIRFSRLDDLDIHFAIEGREIHSNQSTINMKYVFRETVVANWDELLKTAVAARLAAEICVAITGSRGLMADMWNIYNLKMEEARLIDKLEAPVQTMEGTTWLDARLQDEPFRKQSTTA